MKANKVMLTSFVDQIAATVNDICQEKGLDARVSIPADTSEIDELHRRMPNGIYFCLEASEEVSELLIKEILEEAHRRVGIEKR
jgi:putative aminopeptidase FrvX